MRSLVAIATAGAAGLVLSAAPLAAQATSTETGTPPSGPVQAPPPNTLFVFVNTQEILPQVPGAQRAQEAFNQEVAGYNSEMQALAAQLDSLVSQYRQQESMLSQEAKDRRQQEILQRQQEAETRRLELEQRTQDRQAQLLQPILESVRDVIEQIRVENGYTMVFDVAAAGVVAADPSLDITQLVVERLKALDEAATPSDPGR